VGRGPRAKFQERDRIFDQNSHLPKTLLLWLYLPPPGCAVSSVVEHYLDTVGVAGSNPASRTIFKITFTRDIARPVMTTKGPSFSVFALLLAGCATKPASPVVRSAVYESRPVAAATEVSDRANPSWKLIAEYSSQVFNPQNVAWAKSLIYQAARTNGAQVVVFDVEQRRYGSDRPAVYAPSTVTVNTGRQDSFSQGMANGATISQNAWANAAASAPNQVWFITGKAFAKPNIFDSLP
jgi:hypothetical protein